MENGNSKKGLIVSLVAIVAVMVVAGLGYGALTAGQGTAIPNLSSASAASSTAEGEAANADADTGASAGAAASNSADATSSAGAEGSASSGSASSGTNGGYLIFDDFNIKTIDGTEVSLSSFYSKPTLLGFWATWCPPCNAEAPEIQKLWERYGDQVNFVMVDSSVANGRDTPEGIKEWMEQGSYSYPVYYDETGEAAFVTEVYYLPTMYVLDSEGHLLTAFSGTLDVASGSQLIEQLLAL